jgi:hypothetical protein
MGLFKHPNPFVLCMCEVLSVGKYIENLNVTCISVATNQEEVVALQQTAVL